MTTVQLMQAVSKKANQVKKDLTKSYFSGNKNYFNELLNTYSFCEVEGDVYETINNLSAKVAQNYNY